MPNQMLLDDLFFAVCTTAIKNCAWKYADFEKVRAVEGQLAQLHEALIAARNATGENQAGKPENVSTSAPIEPQAAVSPATSEVKEQPEVDVAAPKPEPTPEQPKKKDQESEILTPDQVKEAPVRPMPDEILEAVKDGIEIAKHPPKVRDVAVSELPSDPDAARAAFNKPF